MADHVLPATQGAFATHWSAVAFQAYSGALQPQLDWPTSALLVLYSAVSGHARQLESPSSEKVCAGHAPQTTLAEAEQTEEPS